MDTIKFKILTQSAGWKEKHNTRNKTAFIYSFFPSTSCGASYDEMQNVDAALDPYQLLTTFISCISVVWKTARKCLVHLMKQGTCKN